jgi:hypothetical protein
MKGSLLYDLKPIDLISPQYCELQRELHARPNGYGGKGDKWAQAVRDLVAQFDCRSVLDYGCGEGTLKKALADLETFIRIDEWDPAVPGKETWPRFADLVVCTDMLEHVEPERLTTVLAHIKVLARKAVFVVIATRPSNKTMADGRNAHLILEDDVWWSTRMLEAGFTILGDAPKSPLLKRSREWVAVLLP